MKHCISWSFWLVSRHLEYRRSKISVHSTFKVLMHESSCLWLVIFLLEVMLKDETLMINIQKKMRGNSWCDGNYFYCHVFFWNTTFFHLHHWGFSSLSHHASNQQIPDSDHVFFTEFSPRSARSGGKRMAGLKFEAVGFVGFLVRGKSDAHFQECLLQKFRRFWLHDGNDVIFWYLFHIMQSWNSYSTTCHDSMML